MSGPRTKAAHHSDQDDNASTSHRSLLVSGPFCRWVRLRARRARSPSRGRVAPRSRVRSDSSPVSGSARSSAVSAERPTAAPTGIARSSGRACRPVRRIDGGDIARGRSSKLVVRSIPWRVHPSPEHDPATVPSPAIRASRSRALRRPSRRAHARCSRRKRTRCEARRCRRSSRASPRLPLHARRSPTPP